MPELRINPSSQALIDRYSKDPSHAVLLSGEVGVGLGSIAKHIAAQLTDSAYITVIEPEASSIPIATVRDLYAQTKTKQSHKQVIIIDDADAMRHEAQNALLKLLEEPSSQVYFILTSHQPQLLLATIISRVQQLPIRPISAAESAAFVTSLAVEDGTKLKQILFIAEGRPAELIRLAQDEAYFAAQSAAAVDARAFLAADSYERLILITKYSGREQALEFLSVLSKFAIHMLYRQADTQSARRLDALDSAIDRVNANGNVKTQLTRLVSEWS